MKRFSGVLSQVSEGLDLPEPTKSRILLEMAGDLEDAYQHHLDQGLDDAEAVARAEEAFAASDEAIRHLARIHESGGRFSDRITRQVGSWWEKGLLVVWVLAVLLLAGRVTTAERFFWIVSPFMWVIGALAVAAFALSLWKLRQLFGSRPPDVRRLRTGLGALAFVAAASLVISACGFFYHLRWYARQSYDSGEELLGMFGMWIFTVAPLIIAGLLTAILTALVWFLLAGLVARAERRQADALLGA